MNSKKRMVGMMMCFVLAGCSMGKPVDPNVSRKGFFQQGMFRSVLPSGKRYQGKVTGMLKPSQGETIVLDGLIGFGNNDQQSLIHFEGWVQGGRIDIDVLKEQGDVYVRSRGGNGSGSVMQLLGMIGQANYQFVRLSDFAYRDRIGYLISPISFMHEFSGALSFDTRCIAACPLVIDKDFLPPGDSDLLEFLQAIQTQTLSYNPKKQVLTIDTLQTRDAGVHGSITPFSLDMMRNHKGLTNKVYTASHILEDNKHSLSLNIENDGESVQSLQAIYDLYPDGLNMSFQSKHANGQEIKLEGKRYDVGAFVPVEKGRILDIYGLLNINS